MGFFLAGLVTLGSLQAYWLKPLNQSLKVAARRGVCMRPISALYATEWPNGTPNNFQVKIPYEGPTIWAGRSGVE